jgi:RNA polymerase sigma-70 factor (ECF subfamily)
VGTLRVGIPGVRPSARTVESLVQQYGNQIYKLAYHLTGSTTDAEDVVQEVFLKLFRNWAQVAITRNLSAWIYRIVTNASLDLLRSRQSRARREKPVETEMIEAVAVADGREHPASRLDREELQEKLRLALDALPPQQVAALVLFDHEGLKAREIGQIMGVAEATVRGYVWEARRRVKELLKPYLAGKTA